ncbi:Succinate dehydrogenase cytochrome b small subunit (SDHD) [Blastocystis hominis]|uniref:Succinate dehydrogenase [ubiquinone] cytochrome b small subunit n=1 Tax=Blastocystis hominis TaxID=12968 RepID=D8M114_BLAHO|nr:Succinate dehydrogenase cytochrome b small subunit (SDHD) [Blastocystis hominis]CBK21753.2 Succinate dehydrogenase cytochrome b small subunit (SDHD) [Blastocystis hominis]|eukprot:XP_012895801.1 Succinate dehydrogenase cytochrome b small subunit (SDHD) [Blastocystis hominis]
MAMTMRALRLGQMSAKSISCYASSVAPVFVRFHTPYNYSSPAKPRTLWEGLWNADSTNLHEKIFHYSQLTAACLVPVSFVLAPSALCVPIDYVLCVLYPLHGCIGMSHIFSDYCGPMLGKSLKIATLFLSLLGMFGLLYLNATSDGLTATIKALWRPKIQNKEE